MPPVIHYDQCPVCGSSSQAEVFKVKDHTLSGEMFQILACRACGLRFTQDVPVAEAIGTYYQSSDYISHSNQAKGFINRLYLSVRKRTLRKKRRLVERVTGLQRGRLLDFGAGTGSFVREMKSQGWEAAGLEPDAGARSVGQSAYGLELRHPDYAKDLDPGTFDAITLWHVLEHVHELHNTVETLKTLLKDKGRMLIAVPNYTSADATFYQSHWAAYDVPRHLYHFSPAAMKTLLNKHGLTLEGIRPMWYDSFYISLLSSRYKSGRTGYISAFFNGLRSNLVTLFNKSRCSSLIYIIGK